MVLFLRLHLQVCFFTFGGSRDDDGGGWGRVAI